MNLKFFIIFNIVLFLISSGRSQSSDLTIRIAYTGNLNCNLKACDCPGENLGGMLRLGNAVDSLRKVYPDLILLDSGDFMNSYSLPDANQIAWEMMFEMRYDAISVGDQEFVEGRKFLFNRLQQRALPVTAANIFRQHENLPEFPPCRIITRNQYKIGVIGAIPADAFEFIDLPSVRIEPVGQSIRNMISKIKEQTGLIVLLYHADFQTGIKLARKFPEIAVIVAGHSQHKSLRQLDNQIIVQPGMDGEYLGLLEIRRSHNRLTFKNHFLAMHPGIGEKPGFKVKVEKYYRKINADLN